MILVDTSLWIRHFQQGVPDLRDALLQGSCVSHAWILAELVLGSGVPPAYLQALERMPRLPPVHIEDPVPAIRTWGLVRGGIGLVDAQILLSALSTPRPVALWTADRRLGRAAEKLGVVHRVF